MKTLEEHNKQKHEINLAFENKKVQSGVACDKCGTEMIVPNPHMVLASYPAQQYVQCPNCNHIGLKVV
jgi:DNA-directed RNA polymerase subunit RPC12/RpoP